MSSATPPISSPRRLIGTASSQSAADYYAHQDNPSTPTVIGSPAGSISNYNPYHRTPEPGQNDSRQDYSTSVLSTRSQRKLSRGISSNDEGETDGFLNTSKAPLDKSSRINSKSRRTKIFIITLTIILIVAGIVAGIVVTIKKKEISSASSNLGVAAASDQNSSSASSQPAGTGTATSSMAQPTPVVVSNESLNQASGGDGSVVYLEDGSSFVYNNSFGGTWNAIPFNDTARAQRDVPPLNEPWDYNSHRISGVNLGGWLVLEPFISPAMFEPFNPGEGGRSAIPPTVVDEWTLSVALGENLTIAIEEHYKTFITEKDFAEIAGAGFNWIRLPVPYWMVESETLDGEPFRPEITWKYFLLALSWARKYGLRVNLDLHSIPGSQNGYNHSSKYGTINFLNGIMGWANYQRTRNYIRTLGEFISTPEYENVVGIFSILNEPRVDVIGRITLRGWFLEMYTMLREITVIGRGFYIAFSDIVGGAQWTGFLAGADRIIMDNHPYLIFTDPNVNSLDFTARIPVCTNWGNEYFAAKINFGVFIASEWTLAVNDCGKWINNVGDGARYDGTFYGPAGRDAPMFAGVGSCDGWDDYDNYTEERISGMLTLARANMDAFGDHFFWTWKTGFSPQLGRIANPQWNYQLGLEKGWMPLMPARSVAGACAALVPDLPARPTVTFTPGSGVIDPAQVALYPWPPVEIGTNPPLVITALPSFTATGSIITLAPGPTPTLLPIGYGSMNLNGIAGDGWNDESDTSLFFVKKDGCTYLDPWNGLGAIAPPICA